MSKLLRRSVHLRATAACFFPALTFALMGLLAPPANAGTITLTSAPIGDHGQRVCTLAVPEAGAGKTIRLSLADKGGAGKGNCYDMQPTEIAMKDIPSAAKILLTDDWLCNTEMGTKNYEKDDPEDNRNFFIRLDTVRNLSQLPQIGIDRLLEFEDGQPIWDTDLPGIGFRMVQSKFNGAKRVTRRLSCLEITISQGENPPPSLVPVPLEYSKTVKVESEQDSTAGCPTGEVMVWRIHVGDEKAATSYGCYTLNPGNNEKILAREEFTSVRFPECGRRRPGSEGDDPPDVDCNKAVTYHKDQVDPIYFTCPPNSAIVQRDHINDENGLTHYFCNSFHIGKIDGDANKIIIEPDDWEQHMTEDFSAHNCGEDRVMIGRAHKSDENGETAIRCGRPYHPTNPTLTVTP